MIAITGRIVNEIATEIVIGDEDRDHVNEDDRDHVNVNDDDHVNEMNENDHDHVNEGDHDRDHRDPLAADPDPPTGEAAKTKLEVELLIIHSLSKSWFIIYFVNVAF